MVSVKAADSQLWQSCLMTVTWRVLLEVNDRIFNEKQLQEEEIWVNFRFTASLWASSSKELKATT